MSLEWLQTIYDRIAGGQEIYACPGVNRGQWVLGKSADDLFTVAQRTSNVRQMPTEICLLHLADSLGDSPLERDETNPQAMLPFLYPVEIHPLESRGESQVTWKQGISRDGIPEHIPAQFCFWLEAVRTVEVDFPSPSSSPPTPPPYLVWAGSEINRKWGDEHFLVVGASGSGKSTLINHALHSVLSDPGARALVYDPKQELVPFLYGIRGFAPAPQAPPQATSPKSQPEPKLRSSIKILHPLDRRGLAWDMAADIDSPISARQLATILVPDSESSTGSDGFFSNAVRDILTGIVLAFIECVPNAGGWTLRDVLLTLFYEPYRRFIMQLTRDRNGKVFPILTRLESSYFSEATDARTKANIQATINAKLAVYEPIAAAWHQAVLSKGKEGTFSLRGWLKESPSTSDPGSILVLGNDEAARAALDPINQALFKRATELVLARAERTPQEKESGNNQIWFFLDEIREAGKLDGLGRLLTKGRSKNACVVMGFQDMDGMREVYGDEVANEICAQFNNIAVLRVNSPQTAQWASDLFGRRLEVARNSSTGMSTGQGSGLTMTDGQSEEERPFLYSDAFLFGANAAAARQVKGYCKGPDTEIEGLSRMQVIDAFRFSETTQAPRVTEEALAREATQILGCQTRQCLPLVRPFAERPISHQYLQPWDQADWERLGLVKLKRTPIKFDANPATVAEIVWGQNKGTFREPA